MFTSIVNQYPTNKLNPVLNLVIVSGKSDLANGSWLDAMHLGLMPTEMSGDEGRFMHAWIQAAK